MRDRALQLPPAAVKSYARMLLAALAHVHGRGLVHRDVKPDNLLVDGASGVLKLADFGLARCAAGGLAAVWHGAGLGCRAARGARRQRRAQARGFWAGQGGSSVCV